MVALAVLGVCGLLFGSCAILLVVAENRINPDVDAPELPDITLPRAGAPLPGDRVVFDSNRSGNYELYSMLPDGTDVVQLTDDDRYDTWWGRTSPDRTRILFYRTPATTHDQDFTRTTLWVMRADGSGAEVLLPPHSYGWIIHGHAEWSPDGKQLTMFGGKRSNPQIYITDATGRDPRQLTHDGGTNVDPAWSPDGATITYAGCPSRFCLPSDQEIYVIPAQGGQRERLTDDGIRDNDPYYSPNGTQIAFLSQTSKPGDEDPAGSWNIRLMGSDGTDVRRLTDDDQVNSKPAWSRDGRRIFFHRLVYGTGADFGVWVIDVDGRNMTEVTKGQPGSNEYPGP